MNMLHGAPSGCPVRTSRGARPDFVSLAMDPWIVAAVAMLVLWAVGTFAFGAPGWLNFLLTLGVFLGIWRIVVRGTPSVRRDTDDRIPDAHRPRG